MACPDFSIPFRLETDASTSGLGAVLAQSQNGAERVIAYISRALNAAEKNYSIIELECLAVVWAVRKLRGYLEGYHFEVISDHRSLKWLKTMENPTSRLARWILELQQFDFDVLYRPGAQNVVADTLSRLHEEKPAHPVATAVEKQPSEPWYPRMLRLVQEKPNDWPEYRI